MPSDGFARKAFQELSVPGDPIDNHRIVKNESAITQGESVSPIKKKNDAHRLANDLTVGSLNYVFLFLQPEPNFILGHV